MKIVIDGLNLFQWCKKNGKNYQRTRYNIMRILNQKKEKKPKKTYEERAIDVRTRNRLRSGYSKEEANLSKEDFYNISSQKLGLHFIGRHNLSYVCKKLGIKYNTVFAFCIRRKKMTPEEYLAAKGYDLTPFME